MKCCKSCQSVQGYNGSLPLTFISNDDASVRAFIKTSRGQEFDTRVGLIKKTTFLLCCNHEPVRLTPNINKPRCDYHRFTARVAINNKISVGFGIFFIGCLRNARTSPTYTNLHTTPTDITYRHYLHTPLLTYAITYIRHRLPTLLTYDIPY